MPRWGGKNFAVAALKPAPAQESRLTGGIRLGGRGLIVAGQVRTGNPAAYARTVGKLAARLGWPVLVNEAEKAEYRKVFVRPFAAEASGAFLATAWSYLEMIEIGHADMDMETHQAALLSSVPGAQEAPEQQFSVR